MYSPKINEELIPRLYRLRRLKKIPMTRLVNQMISAVLPELEKREGISGPEAKVDDAIEPQVRDESRVYAGKHQCGTRSGDTGDRRAVSSDRRPGIRQDSDINCKSSLHPQAAAKGASPVHDPYAESGRRDAWQDRKTRRHGI